MEKPDVRTGPLIMPDKNPTADGWGGLGASHENGKPARHDLEAEAEAGREIDRRPARDVDRHPPHGTAPDE